MAEIVWLTILAVTLIFEGWTIWGDDEGGTTMSHFIIQGRAIGVWRVAIVSAIAWLCWHWLFEPDVMAPLPDDDVAIVAVAALATLVRRTPREGMR